MTEFNSYENANLLPELQAVSTQSRLVLQCHGLNDEAVDKGLISIFFFSDANSMATTAVAKVYNSHEVSYCRSCDRTTIRLYLSTKDLTNMLDRVLKYVVTELDMQDQLAM